MAGLMMLAHRRLCVRALTPRMKSSCVASDPTRLVNPSLRNRLVRHRHVVRNRLLDRESLLRVDHQRC